MKKAPCNVAVSAVGGGVGLSIIKALQNTEYTAVGINSEPLGAGLYVTSRSHIGFNADHPGFVDRLVEICDRENCAVLFPGLDAELLPISGEVKKFKDSGVYPIVSAPEVIATCVDKLKTCEFLKKNGFPFPKTYRLKDYNGELSYPVILKPQRGGHRSIGQYRVSSDEQFESLIKTLDVDNYVVQEFIDGEEFTCGTVTLENRCVGVILMQRELRNGDTVKAFVVKDEALRSYLENVINVLKPFGACNVQLKVKDRIPYIFEINARCSGTTASRALAGFNEPKIICDYVFKGIRNPEFVINNIAVLRYWNELVISYDKIDEMRSKGCLSNEAVEL